MSQTHSTPQTRRRRYHKADTFFFPAAILFALIAVPLSVQGIYHHQPLAPGLATPLDHGQELLFGYGLALVTGFMATRVTLPTLLTLATLWLAARVSGAAMPHGALPALLNGLFVLLLATQILPPLLRSAKKWRNQAFGWLLLAVCGVAALYHLARGLDHYGVSWLLLRESVLLFALLMLFVGGRMIAPAVAGAIERQGGRLEARVQPRLEAALLLLMALAIVCAPIPGLGLPAGLALLATAGVAAARLFRWQLWRCTHRPDLIALGVGYGWLVAGTLLLGAVQFGWLAPGTATHAITVGALGALSTAVITRTWGHRHRCLPGFYRWLLLVTALVSLSALLRILWADTLIGLWSAAALWTGAMVFQLALLLWVVMPRGQH